jgi:hypothetical protein
MSKKVTEDNILKIVQSHESELCCIQEEIDNIEAGDASLVIDVTEVTDATDGYLLYNNNGILGELDPNTLAPSGALLADGTVDSTTLQNFNGGIALQDELVSALAIRFGADGNNGFYGVSDTQLGIAVEGVLVGGANTTGLFTDNMAEQTAAAGITADGVKLKDGRVGGYTQTATSNGTVTLTSSSTWIQEFTGSTQYQLVSLGDCTTYLLGKEFLIMNNSTNVIRILDNASTLLRALLPGESGRFTCTNIGSATGAWYVETAVRVRALNKHLHWEEDFECNAIAQSQFNGVVNGTGATSVFAVNTGITSSQVGLASIETGTTATGRSAMGRGNTTTFFGGGVHVFETYVYIPVLSTVTEEYIIYLGFGDATGAGAMTDGVFFKYDRLTSVNWYLVASNNSVTTGSNTDSTIPVAVTTWTKLRVEVNAAGTRADYFINDVNVGNNTANIPITTARITSELLKIEKSAGAGATSSVLVIDYVSRDFIRTTPL